MDIERFSIWSSRVAVCFWLAMGYVSTRIMSLLILMFLIMYSSSKFNSIYNRPFTLLIVNRHPQGPISGSSPLIWSLDTIKHTPSHGSQAPIPDIRFNEFIWPKMCQDFRILYGREASTFSGTRVIIGESVVKNQPSVKPAIVCIGSIITPDKNKIRCLKGKKTVSAKKIKEGHQDQPVRS